MRSIDFKLGHEGGFGASMGIALFGVGALCGGCREPPGTTGRPLPIRPVEPNLRHVVMISIDTLRADHLGCYGHPYVQTPTIDAVAAEGWRFERCVAAAPTTLASHAALMTGSYPHTHGTPRNGFSVNDENVTLAEIMKRYGFTTAGFVGSYALASQFNFDQGFDHFDEDFDKQRSGRALLSAERRADRVTDAALAWLSGRDDERYFLFVHYFDPHVPYDPPPPYDGMYKDATGDFKPRENALRLRRIRKQLEDTGSDGLAPEIKALGGFYCGEISFTDHQIGRLLRGLESRDILDHALVIITSDHGETMTEHPSDSAFNHGIETYDSTVRVPLIFRFPEGQGGGRVIDRVVSSIDILPTLLDWFGMDSPARVEGMSFADLRTDRGLGPREEVFAEATLPADPSFEKNSGWYNAGKTKCVVQNQWKLIHRPLPNQWELYDLDVDPNKQDDLLEGGNPTHATLVDDLKTKLSAWSENADPLVSVKEESERTKSNLKSLGYAH